ncbi:MAG TPA: transposase [Pirellulaceae bacterium]|nr:transposase [Pirellulaceae bacterium]
MPRTSRASRGGFVYHVLNRGNGRSDVFYQDDDFAVFVNLMREAHEKVPMRLAGFCLMTNHFHLLTPFGDTHWQTKTAAILGLQSSLRPPGRPKKQLK